MRVTLTVVFFVCIILCVSICVFVLKPGETETFKTRKKTNYYGQSHVVMM